MPVYFVVRHHDGAIKIGVSVDVARRLFELDAPSVDGIQLLATEPGSHRTESELHHRFRRDRIHVGQFSTEWFRPSDELLAHIATLADKPTEERASRSPFVATPPAFVHDEHEVTDYDSGD
jgi:hypothetical protein